MPEKKSNSSRKIFANVLWALLGIATVVLLSAAIIQKNNRKCKGVEINISGAKNNLFIDKKQVIELLESLSGSKLEGKRTGSFNLAGMENTLRNNEWIKKAEIFFDNNEILRVNIDEREPVARIFTKMGSSFYIDNTVKILPLSDRSSARVPVFTNFPAANSLSVADSNLLGDVQRIGAYILNNDFWMAEIDQVDITADRNFEMIPKIGNHIIVFGSADNYEEKFNHLLTFYKRVATKVGWNKYSKINIEYTNQIVAVKRNAQDVVQDSLRAKQLMQSIVANAQKLSLDSSSNIQLVQPQDDNRIPSAPQSEETPGEAMTSNKPVNSVPDNSLLIFNKKSDPALKKTLTHEPQKNLHPIQPSALSSKTVDKKLQPTKSKSKSVERPNPNPSKKIITKMVAKPIDKSKIKKAVTPNNDY